MPQDVYAGTSVSVYISIGIIVGGASLFFSLAFRESYSQNREKPPDEKKVFLSSIEPFRFPATHDSNDDLPEIGKIKILSWKNGN